MTAASLPARTAPLALWRIAHDFLHTLFMLFGNPEDLAWSHTLKRDAYKLTHTWLRVAEALLRRLLLIEAVAFANTAAPAPRAKAAANPPAPTQFDPTKPETWRVSLRCFYGPPAPAPARAARLTRRPLPIDTSADLSGMFTAPSERELSVSTPTLQFAHEPANATQAGAAREQRRFFSAWPLALRYEALLRAYNDPAPYARRLALRLCKFGHRVRELLRAPDDAHHKIGDEEYAALASATEPAITVFDST